MNSRTRTEALRTDDCFIEYRSIEGLSGREVFYVCRPASRLETSRGQADAMYRATAKLLAGLGSGRPSIVAETVFFSDIRSDLAAVRAARQSVFGSMPSAAITEIEQPPLRPSSRLEILGHAIIGPEPERIREISASARACSCGECAGPKALRVEIGNELRLHAGGIYGAGSDAYEQTRAMFDAAEALLNEAGMTFRDVMRTWIHFAAMDRDYDGFNRARREFFRSRSVDPVPASTGIGAGLAAEKHSLCLSLYAVAGPSVERTVMSTPTLNEAPEYGSDFSRGMRVEEANRSTLFVSGTASLDEEGKTVHLGRFAEQADRMLLNVAGLLEQQGAAFHDIAYAITYVKTPGDAARLGETFSTAGYHGFPSVIVEAPVCRPELLCETEALAVLSPGGP